MKSQVLICSYHKDFQWLIHCLGSLKRFSSGFLHPVVCVDAADREGAKQIVAQSYPEATVVVKDGRTGQGFMRAQIAMMSGDIICPEADFVFLLGSDTIAAGEFTPGPFFSADGNPVMLYTTYEDLNVPRHSNAMPWRKGTERIMGFEPHAEFMRRLPLVYPKSLFAPFREYVANLHRMDFEDFIYTNDAKFGHTSESNCMGAWAWKFAPELYEWVDTRHAGVEDGEVKGWPSKIRQFWSRGGLDRVTEANFLYGNGKCSRGRTPREIINSILYGIDN